MIQELKKTPLNEWHTRQKAKMGAFGGYEMPLWYETGPKIEHLSVIQKAGLFDTSHMSPILVSGKESEQLLQLTFSKDLGAGFESGKRPLPSGRCVYGVFLHEDGTVLDDALVYRIESDRFLVVVNAGMGQPVKDHLADYCSGGGPRLADLTDQLGKMDIQGPLSGRIILEILGIPAKILKRLPYFGFSGSVDESGRVTGQLKTSTGIPILLSRTGYTGELGFEIFVDTRRLVELWQRLFSGSGSDGPIACGLAARDSLRAGAGLPLSHQDIGSWVYLNHPWLFTLPFDRSNRSFTKNFIGSEALLNTVNAPYTYPFAGYDLRKVIPGDQTTVEDESGRIIGRVLTCVTDMAIGRFNGKIFSVGSPDKPGDLDIKGLCCGFIRVDENLTPGRNVYLVSGNRRLKVEIVTEIRPDRTARKKIL